MMTIDIVCPVFREEASIGLFHRALLEGTAPLSEEFTLRYIYVVDPSPDRSEALLREIAHQDNRVTVIVMSRRFGHQAALIAGIDASTGDAVVMLDSDMQHPPSLIPTLVQHWKSGADIVQTLRQDGSNISAGKRWSSALFYRLFTRFSKIQINSGAADFRLLSRKVADVFRTELREHNPFFRGLVTWIGYKIVYVPFPPASRAAGQSNYPLYRLFIFALNGLCSFSKLPLRVCIALGFFFALLSLIGGLVLVLLYFMHGNTYVPGWASLFALLAFASSINLFFLGVLGEYVGLIFDEVKNRPRYLIGGTYGPQSTENPTVETPRRSQ
jgi:glycosyltransferase involved in cell wall biosynthesis